MMSLGDLWPACAWDVQYASLKRGVNHLIPDTDVQSRELAINSNTDK